VRPGELKGRTPPTAGHAVRLAKESTTTWAAATAQQLLERHGVLTREAVMSESVAGGFGVIYPVLKTMEESGRVRRGYFIAGLGATQFALPGALDLLRSMRDPAESPEVAVMSATDPANPYGATLKWPAFAPSSGRDSSGASARQARLTGPDATSARQAPTTAPSSGRDPLGASAAQAGSPGVGGAIRIASAPPERSEQSSPGRGPTRTVGATVVLVDGALVAYLARGDRQLLTWLPEAEPQRARAARAVSGVLIERARTGGESPRGMLIEDIDGAPAPAHPIAPFLAEAGFIAGAMGMQATYTRR
jgi:ATP-dependent Lhr-like helicase